MAGMLTERGGGRPASTSASRAERSPIGVGSSATGRAGPADGSATGRAGPADGGSPGADRAAAADGSAGEVAASVRGGAAQGGDGVLPAALSSPETSPPPSRTRSPTTSRTTD